MSAYPDDRPPLLEVSDLHTTFPIRSAWLRRIVGQIQAVAGVSFTVRSGETLGLVGESGSGKSTLARTIMGLETAARGTIRVAGADISTLRGKAALRMRRDVQMVFQDPYSSLNPRRTIGRLIAEPWELHGDLVPKANWRREAAQLLVRVGLGSEYLDRYPHQLSGGQRQRVSIARALAMRPKVLVCDEAVSALDVSVQAQVLNLLEDLQREFELTYLFVAHDLSVVRHISDRVMVMYLGKVVEMGDRNSVFDAPAHPYTVALLSAIPSANPWSGPQRKRIILSGQIPSPANPPTGCPFRTRCWKATDLCAEVAPPLELKQTGTFAACHFPETPPVELPASAMG